jgi:hypothetical protein
MKLLKMIVEDSIRQSKLISQRNELSFRALNGTRQTRQVLYNTI